LRADSQAIVVGSGTARTDRPRLTVRAVAASPHHPPLRVVLDAHGRVPADGPLFDVADAPTLVVTTIAAPAAQLDVWRAAGAKVEVVAAATDGTGVDLDETFALLAREGALQALVEGGGTLLGRVLSGGHAARLVAYVAPLALGARAVPALAFQGPDSVDGAPRFALTQVTRLGPDVRLDYEVPS
jgi:diaminohydroxyphosphoribosylaminopyrimidine deaminase/5-amino-6-(5-phosphoribosylamino)uracil reductase